MNNPDKLSFSDEATFTFVRGEVIIFIVIVTFVFILTLATTDATLRDLALPFGAIFAFGGIWLGILFAIAMGHRIGEKAAIHHMFKEEIWECWQYTAPEWQVLVEAESNLISPKDEGLKPFMGAVYSTIFGIIIALVLFVVGLFAIDDPGVKSAMWIGAVAIFLLLVGIGLFQPLAARYKAYEYQRKALKVAKPQAWFGRNGVYHETLGYLSLKGLQKITDQTRARKRILFTLTVSTPTHNSSTAYPFPVPAGCEERASRLVRRYRQEWL